jgi:hypothetical protein
MWSSDESTNAAVSSLDMESWIYVCMIEGSYIIDLPFLLIKIILYFHFISTLEKLFNDCCVCISML